MKIFPPPGKAVEAHFHEQQDNRRPSTFFTDAGASPLRNDYVFFVSIFVVLSRSFQT